MTEAEEERKARLHAEIDAEYGPFAEAVGKTATGLWLARDAFWFWREEKIHVDKFGKRFPKITNIQVPQIDY